MKKLLLIGGIIIVIFGLIVFMNKQANETKLQDSPYGTKDVKQSTIDLIGDKNYQNIVMPDELYEKISSGEEVTAYFFSPECQYCMKMTPILMPIAQENDIHVYQYNMLEFNKESQPYGITSWPTLVHYKDGKEVTRSVGLPENPEADIQAFFDKYDEE
ncbi:thioredoxin family protein [Sporosarcina oncorhynchi]|uniref:Thioredoxin family protein n=1 Tax=Sporosarcina oncorhynchi TaxID=3056444 RepID=A0ABZ0L252_9BACL|nr:thioredoxin family protein [Sporosarcina sp. T2O-4]WOV86596.1 thioredoxin family protein [Sporosarcina sp. T2O-4]